MCLLFFYCAETQQLDDLGLCWGIKSCAQITFGTKYSTCVIYAFFFFFRDLFRSKHQLEEFVF